LAVLVCLAPSLLHADIKNWQTHETIPDTEGTTPGLGVQLDHRELEYAKLSELDLTDANFELSNLAYASLRGSTLRGSTLTDANLTGANLAYASLGNSTLTNANLTDAVVNGTWFKDTTSQGFSKEQLYSTASYQATDL
jgi:uncharacterized protein YjbI with pentapeptide repeats